MNRSVIPGPSPAHQRSATRNQRTSRGWQREAAEALIAGRGVIVAEYFDTGLSREVPWARRPPGSGTAVSRDGFA